MTDTGVFDHSRYFDVFVEYAKAAPEDMLIRITVANRGLDAAAIHLLPTVWFRNTWSWGAGGDRPRMRRCPGAPVAIELNESSYGKRWLVSDGEHEILFTENETNEARLYGSPDGSQFTKDSINDRVVHGAVDRVNPEQFGTKAAVWRLLDIPAGGQVVVRLRLTNAPGAASLLDPEFSEIFAARKREADEFYSTVVPTDLSEG